MDASDSYLYACSPSPVRMWASWRSLIPSISTFSSVGKVWKVRIYIGHWVDGHKWLSSFYLNTTDLYKLNTIIDMFSFKFSHIILKVLQMCLHRPRCQSVLTPPELMLLWHPSSKSVCIIWAHPHRTLLQHGSGASVFLTRTLWSCISSFSYHHTLISKRWLPFTRTLLKREYWLNLTTFR